MSNSLKKGHLYNLLSVLMMAVGPLLSKFGLVEISPAKASVINAITVIFASYLLGLLQNKKVTFYFEKEIIMLALFNSIGVIFLFLSTHLLSPVEIGFIGRFYTVFAVLLSVLLLKEKLSKNEIIFISLAILGAFLFVHKDGNYESNILGSFFAILYTFFFALTNIFIKKSLTKEKESNSILFTNNCITFIFLFLYATFTGDLFTSGYSLTGISYIVISSLCTGFLGTLFLYQALNHLRFAIANVTRAFSPLLLAVISFPFFPIEITFQNTAGAIVLIISILLLSFGERNKSKSSDTNKKYI
ncbi:MULTISPECIES: DMT family transporter [Clostridia]|uniref:DMT family transporter n=1 Tax=Clostridia TaxID=186801 RepID=UPI000EA1C9C7|nr:MULTISPECIES: DMT family transporter [Clostridia]NBJ70390.1 DMT family transporter [Roseburia sp. 1XD42-34]RKI76384.1 DMT family transporter [Clostridium sp. 1xD42-85]